MKKNSKLALLLSLILGATMLLPACGDTGSSESSSSSSSGGSSNEPTVEEMEAEANKGYKARMAEWLKYVEYDAPEETPVLTYSTLTKKDTDDEKTTVDASNVSYGFFATSSTTEEVKEFPVDDGTESEGNEGGAEGGEGTGTEGEGTETPEEPETVEKVVSKTTIEKVYSAETATAIKTLTSKQVRIGGVIVDEDTYTLKDEVSNVLNTGFAEGIFEVTTTKYELKEKPEDATVTLDEFKKDLNNYETVVTYSYYDKAGNEIAKDLEKKGTVSGEFVTLGEKTYLVRDGEIIKTFKAGEQYALPNFDTESSIQIVDIDDSPVNEIYVAQGYAYYEQGDYGYCIREEMPTTMKFGDFYSIMFPSVQIEIVKDYDVVLDYESDAYAIMSYTVLSNGNVYICEYRQLNAAATEYDIFAQDMKFDVAHVILDVATGEVKTVEKDYVAQKLYTNATAEIKSLNCEVTMGDVVGGCKVKDGYALVQIQKVANGAISGKSVYAVLDADLNIVAELPAVIPNQFGYVGFLAEDKVLLNTSAIGENEGDIHSIYYMADVETGDLQLYLHSEKQGEVTYIENGFIYDEKVYDYNWNELYDLDDEDLKYWVRNGVLIMQEDDNRPYIGKIVVESNNYYDDDDDKWGASQSHTVSYDFDTEEFVSGYSSSDHYTVNVTDDYIKVVVDPVSSSNTVEYTIFYDMAGTRLLIFESEKTFWEYDEDDSSKWVKYEMTTATTVTELSEGVYLLKATETWTVLEYRNYETRPANKTYTRYFIMK